MTTLPLPAGDVHFIGVNRCTSNTETLHRFSDGDDDSTCSELHSTNGDSPDDHAFSCFDVIARASSVTTSECSVEVEEVSGIEPFDSGLREDRDCRICHSSLYSENNELGVSIELGCSCKRDLGVAHKHCAESWFKVKGNRICEICKTTAENVAEQNEVESTREPTNQNRNAVVMVIVEPPFPPSPTPPVVLLPMCTPHSVRFCNGRRFLNFLLACMVFALVISWLFRFNVS